MRSRNVRRQPMFFALPGCYQPNRRGGIDYRRRAGVRLIEATRRPECREELDGSGRVSRAEPCSGPRRFSRTFCSDNGPSPRVRVFSRSDPGPGARQLARPSWATQHSVATLIASDSACRTLPQRLVRSSTDSPSVFSGIAVFWWWPMMTRSVAWRVFPAGANRYKRSVGCSGSEQSGSRGSENGVKQANMKKSDGLGLAASDVGRVDAQEVAAEQCLGVPYAGRGGLIYGKAGR